MRVMILARLGVKSCLLPLQRSTSSFNRSTDRRGHQGHLTVSRLPSELGLMRALLLGVLRYIDV